MTLTRNLLVALPVALGLAAAQNPHQKTLTVSGPVDLEVKTGTGGVKVRAGDAGSVIITAGQRLDDQVTAPVIEQNGNAIRVGQATDANSYDIVTPPDTRLRISTGKGSQTISGLRGPVTAEAASGSLAISAIAGDVEATTASGSIHLSSITGKVRASAGSGSIAGDALLDVQASSKNGSISLRQVGGSGGDVKVKTASGTPIAAFSFAQAGPGSAGKVEVQAEYGSVSVAGVQGPMRIKTGSGSISAQGELGGEWNLETGSGSIDVRLPAEAAFDFHARTGAGAISIGHPFTAEGADSRVEKRGKVRGGGPKLFVSAGAGSIQVR